MQNASFGSLYENSRNEGDLFISNAAPYSGRDLDSRPSRMTALIDRCAI